MFKWFDLDEVWDRKRNPKSSMFKLYKVEIDENEIARILETDDQERARDGLQKDLEQAQAEFIKRTSTIQAAEEQLKSRDGTIADLQNSLQAAGQELELRDGTIADLRNNLQTTGQELELRDRKIAGLRNNLDAASEELKLRDGSR
ncbi:hypothetical protein BDK51DRAFT_35030 [Blyttiomyces helicus]|uniref:Uncharacterized protein n=1 Tax=Blyttiomyces helicus TaxID=388810 RepID=A0A4P9WGH4_9FUNG|nr:hypothetical protein BDK51DRAFT_35030 [Blyttiomyces helicus]|eukprot:RKO91442.1 hypothetical protein BDK51DRAFT_35030 [Blyttiomyces helicus]